MFFKNRASKINLCVYIYFVQMEYLYESDITNFTLGIL